MSWNEVNTLPTMKNIYFLLIAVHIAGFLKTGHHLEFKTEPIIFITYQKCVVSKKKFEA